VRLLLNQSQQHAPNVPPPLGRQPPPSEEKEKVESSGSTKY
jgi:hypothetical protein